jgi:hypothetical protein
LTKSYYRDSSLRPYVDKDIATAHCLCKPDTGCDQNCMNRQVRGRKMDQVAGFASGA